VVDQDKKTLGFQKRPTQRKGTLPGKNRTGGPLGLGKTGTGAAVAGGGEKGKIREKDFKFLGVPKRYLKGVWEKKTEIWQTPRRAKSPLRTLPRSVKGHKPGPCESLCFGWAPQGRISWGGGGARVLSRNKSCPKRGGVGGGGGGGKGNQSTEQGGGAIRTKQWGPAIKKGGNDRRQVGRGGGGREGVGSGRGFFREQNLGPRATACRRSGDEISGGASRGVRGKGLREKGAGRDGNWGKTEVRGEL